MNVARLTLPPLGAVRLLGRECLSHELHGVGDLAGLIHLHLDIAVVFALLEVEVDDAELAQARAQRRDVRAELLDAFLEEREGIDDAR